MKSRVQVPTMAAVALLAAIGATAAAGASVAPPVTRPNLIYVLLVSAVQSNESPQVAVIHRPCTELTACWQPRH